MKPKAESSHMSAMFFVHAPSPGLEGTYRRLYSSKEIEKTMRRARGKA
jgi:hypothetical protein